MRPRSPLKIACMSDAECGYRGGMATSHVSPPLPAQPRADDRAHTDTGPRRRAARGAPGARGALTVLIAALLALVGATAGAQPAAAAVEFDVMFSATSDRSAPAALDGATVDGTLYAFIAPETDVETVAFYLDDPTKSGTPENIETNPPFDFNGGSVTNGWGYSTEGLANGSHTITAEVTTTTGTVTTTATFTVDNPVVPDEFTLLYSDTSDRAAPVQLDGAVVGGTLYAFTKPDTAVASVSFYIDDPDMSGAPHTIENTAPFDLGGGLVANSFGVATAGLGEGLHVLTAEITTTDTATTVIQAEFTVDNNDTIPMPEDFDIVVSESADRTGAVALEGATVDDDVFVFTTPDTDVLSVEFYVDDPTMSGTPMTTDTTAPFDLAGGDATAAVAFDTTTLSDDQHNVTARIVTTEGVTTVEADFTVDNESDIVPLNGARLADSRPGNPTVDGMDQAFGRMAAGSVKEIQVTGRGGVPAGAAAVLLNVTAVRPDATGYLTVFACDDDQPLASNVNYFAGGIEPNAVLAKLSADGKVCVFTFASTELVVDVNGYVS
jgi:hypothetical protein